MRHVSQTIELALSLLTKDPVNAQYMCIHLHWMTIHNYITEEECSEALGVINLAIGNHVTLANYLRAEKMMPKYVAVLSPEFQHYQLTFYRNLISKLRKEDPMYLIIEAAYHCAHSNSEIHAAIKAAGLPETSDETIAHLLGEYADALKG